MQPDFVITAKGEDITKLTDSWEINDVDDGISSMKVIFVNDQMKYCGKFFVGDKLKIKFGHQNNLSGEVTMEIKDYGETFTDHGMMLILIGMDGGTKLPSTSVNGTLGKDHLEAMKNAGSDAGVKLTVEGLEATKLAEGQEVQSFGESVSALLSRLAPQCKNTKSGGGKAGRSGSSGSPRKGVPGKGTSGHRAKTSAKERSQVGVGVVLEQQAKLKETAPEGEGSFGDAKSEINELAANKMGNTSNAAAGMSIRGHLEVVGYPGLRAKKGVTVLNVGPDASGKWYVSTCTQIWSVKHGYWTRCELLKESVGKDGDKADQPIILHSKIYDGEDQMRLGPREIDAGSQATFTYGQDDKTIKVFKWNAVVQESAGAGEGGKAASCMQDDAENHDKNSEKPDITSGGEE